MPEFLTLLPPDQARDELLSHLATPTIDSESIDIVHALGRFTAADTFAPHPLPDFPRTTVDGYAVRAKDTFGASDSLPAYLTLIGEVPMGDTPSFELGAGQCALIHTGGMLPNGADAAVMIEYTQTIASSGRSPEDSALREIEIFKSVADGENVIRIGEDVAQNQLVIPKGTQLRPAEIGGLMALGFTSIHVAKKPRVGLISTGDEVIDPSQTPRPGQVRDINSYTLGALVEKSGGVAIRYGIFSDQFQVLKEAAAKALSECDMLIITAGSSASTRDMTADVIRTLGEPGVLGAWNQHKTRQANHTGCVQWQSRDRLARQPCQRIGERIFIRRASDRKIIRRTAKTKSNCAGKTNCQPPIASRPRRLVACDVSYPLPVGRGQGEGFSADPIFGKSNLIFTLAAADGLLRIHPDATGLSAGEMVEVILI